jgi:dipeptidyl aminopeptidase/acylaminoacyl peptidase
MAPLMVIQGVNDPRIPLSESEKMVEALRWLGKTVEYLVFDDEGHDIFRLKNKKVAYPAIISFLEKLMK